MKKLLIIITALASLAAPALADRHDHKSHENHSHTVVQESQRLARGVTFRAVCSRGDLNASYPTRAAALAAASAHQRATKHQTNVVKN